MYEVLHKYLANQFKFTEEEFEFIKLQFTPRSVVKGEILQHAGDIPKYGFFVEHGCLRMYTIDAKIKERIVTFAPETWWVGDLESGLKKIPSEYFVDAIEDSEVLLQNAAGHLALMGKLPAYAASFQTGMQKSVAAVFRRIVSSLNASAEEKYQFFLDRYPSLVLRVPQHMLASYLGITPETLSRVRKKMSKRNPPRSPL